MPTLKEKREQRANAWSQAKEFNSRAKAGETLSAEDEGAWQRAIDDVDRLGAEIEREERSDVLDAKFSEVDAATRHVNAAGEETHTAEGEYRTAFEKFCRGGLEGLATEERQTLQANFRALGTTSGSVGGYTVPEGFWAKVTETMKFYGGAVAGAEVITTSSGNPLPWPTNDDTANVGYILGENTAASNEADLSFGAKTLGAYTFVSGPGLVSLQVLQDSGIDIESFVARKMGERLGRIQNTRFTTGSGSSQPQGYVTGATTGKTAAATNAITVGEIIDLIHSVDAAYRATGRCLFKLNDLVLSAIRKLKDDSGGSGYGRPLWEPSIQAGQPDTLFGYGIAINNDMASTLAASAKSVAFGDFQSAFVVRRVSGGSLMRLTERYADYLQVGFIAYERADALVQDTSAVKLLVQAAS